MDKETYLKLKKQGYTDAQSKGIIMAQQGGHLGNTSLMQMGGQVLPSPYKTYYPSIVNNYDPSPYIQKPELVTQSDFTGSPFETTSFTQDPRTTTQQLGSSYSFSDEFNTGTYNPAPKPIYNDITRTNVFNPYAGVDLSSALSYAGQGFGSGNGYQAGLGTGLSVLKGARSFLTGYASGKESKRVQGEMYDDLYNPKINYQTFQEGGKAELKNSDMLTNQYITDEPLANYNIERNEYVKRNADNQVQLAVGEPHIRNGKVADGIDVRLENGDKVLSNYTKIPAKNIKELKERYDISLKKGATFADAQKAYDRKLGIQKETDELSTLIEKSGKNSNTADETTRILNDATLSKEIEASKKKLDLLNAPQAMMFEDLFNIQESLPKKGDGELLDKNGKPIAKDGGEKYQQGGIADLAKKFGITEQRAQELLALQEGGEPVPQEEVPSPVSQEQVLQFVTQSLQNGANPEEVVQQLIQNGLPQEMAMQIVQQVIQESQQEAPVEGEIPVAQQGVLTYDVNTGRNTYKTSPRVFQSPTEGKAYGVSDPQVALQNLYNNFPDLIATEFKDNITIDDLGNVDFKKNLSLNKEQEIVRNFQQKADSRMRASAKTIIDNPKNFSPKMVEESKRYLEEETFLDKAGDAEDAAKKIRGFDSKLGNFTSGRYSMGLNLLTPEDLETAQKSGIKTFKQLKNSPLYSKLSTESKKRTDNLDKLIGSSDADYTLTEVKVPTVEITDTSSNLKPEIIDRNITKTTFPLLPDDLRMFPSALNPLYKEQIALSRAEPNKLTTEPFLASQEAQRQADVARVQASGLPPQLQEAILAQGLATSQLSANDAIAKIETANQANQAQVDQFNLGQRSKEDLTNLQFSQQYENQMLGGLNAYEAALRAYYTEGNLQNRADYKTIENINLINAANDQYAYNPGTGVEFLNNRPANISLPSLATSTYDIMTLEQVQAYKQKEIARARAEANKGYITTVKTVS